ncbi:MAG: MFS transporter [Bacillota bacterium]
MRNIIFLGLVSFFADVSTEMVYPVLPLYLTAAFGASPALLGLIEGIAESVASLLKVFSGYLTDRWGKKKPVAFAGYAAGLLYKAALLFASSWTGVLAARVIDRLGKGVRTAPRDVMVSESAGKNGLGKAFGVHKALDMAGAATGILLSYLLIGAAGARFTYKSLFMVSAIPALIGLSMFLFVKEKQSTRPAKTREQFWNNARLLPGGLKLYLAVAFLFTLGNSSNAFLLLRAKSAGFDDASVILLYFLFNVTAVALSIPLGRLSDRVGRKRLGEGPSHRRVCAVRRIYRHDSGGGARVYRRDIPAPI